ncbi:MAG TPA: (2Fe-2S)-binding protein [Bryobacteraceae bacterium]|nr:(2Fe-2S)-binding protein [Bryobacteraceae bacterium]
MIRRCKIEVTVNGQKISTEVEPRRLLSDFLREDLGLTGTHVGCEHGVCGACTILFDGEAARSCLMFAVQINRHEIDTIEGLSDRGALTDLQASFTKHHALQCGFCTPGMLVVAYDLLRSHPAANIQDVKEGMSAAICRCTGYWNIIRAVLEVAAQARSDEAHRQ